MIIHANQQLGGTERVPSDFAQSYARERKRAIVSVLCISEMNTATCNANRVAPPFILGFVKNGWKLEISFQESREREESFVPRKGPTDNVRI